MSRTPRIPIDYDVQLQLLESKIEKYRVYVGELQAQKQALLSKQQEASVRDLLAFMAQSNMTAKDIIQKLSDAEEIAAAASVQATVEV